MNPIASAYVDDIISVIRLSLDEKFPVKFIVNIFEIYGKFSKVSGLANNAANKIFGITRNKGEPKVKQQMDKSINDCGADENNFSFNRQEMKLLGDTISIGKDETN